MTTPSFHGGHSARVNMWLRVGEKTIEIAQMGPDFLLVDSPIDHPPSNAVLVLHVDESKSRWEVYLPDGISASSKRIEIAKKL